MANKTYTLTLDPNGGFMPVSGAENTKYTTEPRIITIESGVVPELPTPKRPGYTFDAWYKSNDGFWDAGTGYEKITKDDPWKWNRNIHAKAHWIPFRGTIIWDSNGGVFSDGRTQMSNVKYGDVIGKLLSEKNPTRTGYDLVGWFTHPIRGIQVDKHTNIQSEKIKDGEFS